MYSSFDRVAMVECIDNGKTVEAEIIAFVEGKYLSVSLNTVKVNMQYNQRYNIYIGSMSGLEFQSPGPKLLGKYR